MTTETTKLVAEQNDQFRKNLGMLVQHLPMIPGKYLVTRGVQKFGPMDQLEVFDKVRNYNNFNEDNDPYGEHDFGSFKQNSENIFWKIDYYDANYDMGSSNSSDLTKTKRVLTVMLVCEY